MNHLDMCRGIVALSQHRQLTKREAAELSKALSRLEKPKPRKGLQWVLRLLRRKQ